MRSVALGLVCCLPVLSACIEAMGERDPHEPGTALGRYHVVGTQVGNTCGEGALGATRSWAFDVELARDEGVLYWNNGATVVPGVLDDDEVSFSIEARVVVDMRGGDMPPGLPCSIERRDVARGKLDNASDDVERFEGTMTFEFAPTTGSRCEDLVVGELSVEPQFTALPCWIVYDLAAKRSAKPPE